MSLSILGPKHSSDELQALRRLITELAPQCGLNLKDRAATRDFLDGHPLSRSEHINPQLCAELRAMLILLFRLEGSSSEDLGVEGMRRLWCQHSEILDRFDAGNSRQAV